MLQYTNPARYIQALVDYANQIGDVTPLETLRDTLAQEVLAGKGKEMVISSPGGKTFEFQIAMTVQEQFAAVVSAIKQYNDDPGDGPVTFCDFSRLSS